VRESRSRTRDDVREMSPADWTSMTPADWMSMTPADWVNMTRSSWTDPQRLSELWQRNYGDLMNARPADWLTMMYGQRSATPASPRQSRGYGRHEHHGPHGRGCRCHEHHGKEHERHGDCCRRCGSDPCACICCIGDVDLAI